MKPIKLKFKDGVASTPVGDYWIFQTVFGNNNEWEFSFKNQSGWIGKKTKKQAIQKAQEHFNTLVLSCLQGVDTKDKK